MTDLALSWNDGKADLVFDQGDLVIDESILPAVLVSLFTDRRAAESDELPDNSGDRRGWWADTFNEDGSQTGSRLWLFSREEALASKLQLVEDYDREALQWLVDQGILQAVSVAASMPAPNMLLHTIQLIDSSGDSKTLQLNDPKVQLT